MKRALAAAAGLVVLAGLAYGAETRTWGRTGDRTFDSMLAKLDAQATADPEGFIRLLSTQQGLPEQDIRQARDTHGLGAADLFMATALAQATHRPVLAVADEYTRNPGRGWGVMAKDMGIKPGSREFHAMKNNARGSLDHMKADARDRRKHEREMKQQERQRHEDAQGPGRRKSR